MDSEIGEKLTLKRIIIYETDFFIRYDLKGHKIRSKRHLQRILRKNKKLIVDRAKNRLKGLRREYISSKTER